ncbi:MULTISPECIES: bifunctional riboflavin kinase/FAD synthetase [unclassified Thioalkalivibrio]|uniref:bifunctional riboflavin kinase/FAD synthetase n=1 Tax=unclassified Thioalkalivibrio TaxID=2621013 RepID=UPI0003713863|nr:MULTISPECIES: bifunctional riboflavin kinase/FAD synthetase [unclassified Thioalkalivibrio]
MRLIRGLGPSDSRASTAAAVHGAVVTIGNFDGFHRGHQAVLGRLLEAAQDRQAPSVLMTFEPLPREYFGSRPEAPDPPGRLQRLRDRLITLGDTALEAVWILRFDAQLAGLSATAFIEEVLHQRLGAQHVLVGDDFRFGRGREGDQAFMRREGERLGFSVEGTPTVADAEGRISSTRVRAAALDGDFTRMAELLGRSYRLHGRVAHGDKRGRTIGFPTANLRMGPWPLALRGVYSGWLRRASGEALPAVANIGWRPTVAGTEQRLEAHVLEGSPDLYGEAVCFEPIAQVRGEQRFDGLDALRAQIARDVETARQQIAEFS